eukprot:1818684-Amphidinium_carterae.1
MRGEQFQTITRMLPAGFFGVTPYNGEIQSIRIVRGIVPVHAVLRWDRLFSQPATKQTRFGRVWYSGHWFRVPIPPLLPNMITLKSGFPRLFWGGVTPVSYTHLTLPTILLV